MAYSWQSKDVAAPSLATLVLRHARFSRQSRGLFSPSPIVFAAALPSVTVFGRSDGLRPWWTPSCHHRGAVVGLEKIGSGGGDPSATNPTTAYVARSSG